MAWTNRPREQNGGSVCDSVRRSIHTQQAFVPTQHLNLRTHTQAQGQVKHHEPKLYIAPAARPSTAVVAADAGSGASVVCLSVRPSVCLSICVLLVVGLSRPSPVASDFSCLCNSGRHSRLLSNDAISDSEREGKQRLVSSVARLHTSRALNALGIL